MEKQMKKVTVRIMLAVNYLSLFSVVGLFHGLNNAEASPYLYLWELLPIALLIWSFVIVFWRSGMWNMVHYDKKFDERENAQVLEALRLAYGIFSILVLLVIYVAAVIDRGPITVIGAAGLLYLAHTLPAAVLGWKVSVTE